MRRPTPSPALYLAAASMVARLGGTAFAGFSLPTHSVGTPGLKQDAVTGAKVAHRSLTGDDLRSSTLGKVPEAKHARTADEAGHAKSADAAGHDHRGVARPPGRQLRPDVHGQIDTLSNQQIIGCDLVAGTDADHSLVQGSSSARESSMMVNSLVTTFVTGGIARCSAAPSSPRRTSHSCGARRSRSAP